MRMFFERLWHSGHPPRLTCITAAHLLRRIIQTDTFDRFTVLGCYFVGCIGEIFGSANYPLHSQIKKGCGDAGTQAAKRAAMIEMAVS